MMGKWCTEDCGAKGDPFYEQITRAGAIGRAMCLYDLTRRQWKNAVCRVARAPPLPTLVD